MRQVFLDTETTGLSPEAGDRIVEIGCIEMDNRRLTGRTLHAYLNPQRPVGESAQIHGLTDAFLADKPLFGALAGELLDFVRGAEVIIHNAAFDIGFLDAELRRLGQPAFAAQVHGVLDSLLMARELFPGKSNSLDALCKRLEVDHSSRIQHGALLDAGLLAEVYIRMTRGQGALAMDAAPQAAAHGGAPSVSHDIDLAALNLPVLAPTADELLAHQAVLAELNRACNGQAVWCAPAADTDAAAVA